MVCDFVSSDSWVILSLTEQSVKRKIEAEGTPFKDCDIQINYDIKAGFNDTFTIKKCQYWQKFNADYGNKRDRYFQQLIEALKIFEKIFNKIAYIIKMY